MNKMKTKVLLFSSWQNACYWFNEVAQALNKAQNVKIDSVRKTIMVGELEIRFKRFDDPLVIFYDKDGAEIIGWCEDELEQDFNKALAKILKVEVTK